MSESHSPGETLGQVSLQDTAPDFVRELCAQRDGLLPEPKPSAGRCSNLPAWCYPSLGWPLLLLLALSLVVYGNTLADYFFYFRTLRDAFIPGALLAFLLTHVSALCCIVGALAIYWRRQWGFYSYLVGACCIILSMVFNMPSQETAGLTVMNGVILFLSRRKWDEFE